MNIFYEEGGRFKTAAVVQKNDSTYQADTRHGKRAKIKAAHVFFEFDGDADAFLEAASAEAAAIDTGLLWEVCGEEEIGAEALAAEYFGGTPDKVRLAATLMALYAAPMYFYKKSKGIFKAAPEETLKQALAAIERKKQQEAQIQAWADELVAGRLPQAVAGELKSILHAPDKQSPAYKAFVRAADELKTDAYDLAKRVGGIASVQQYLLERFESRNFPHGTGFPDIPVPALPDLPLAEGVRAFSVDDADTTEVDDAFSVQDLGNGIRRIGIHIAAPALAVAANSPIENIIADRQSTVYYPGGKITMLPENWIAAFSLDEGNTPSAFSIYFDADEDFNLSAPVSRIERVAVETNLRIQDIEPFFNSDTGVGQPENPRFARHADLAFLYRLAVVLQKKRDRYEENAVKRYDYSIGFDDGGRVEIRKRERGSPIDTAVSEMMILANTAWAQMLHESGTGGIFRVQPSGRVRMSTHSEPHIGMNVLHYGWFTSPLRRAADCINQQQLKSLLLPDVPPRYAANDSMLFAAVGNFESAHNIYREFQDTMEAYWSMVYLEQNGIRETNAVVLKDDLVRLDGLPLVCRATGIPLEVMPKSTVKLAVTGIDSEKQTIGLRYENVVPAAVTAVPDKAA